MAAAAGERGSGNAAPLPWAIAPVVAGAAFMEVLDISIANVALEHIAGNLGASGDEATWVLTSYLVTNAIVLPISGWLSTVMGRKRFFMACIGGFAVASLLCGIAPNLACLILFRALQGLVGGGLQPVAQAILADSFPPQQRGVAFGIFGMAVVAAPAIGPTLGGWLTDNYSWRWVFLINVPVGIALLSLVGRTVHDTAVQEEQRRRLVANGVRVDYVGFALLCLGLGFLQIVMDRGQQDDWFGSPFITACAAASAVGLLFFVVWELAQDEPIVDLRLLLNRNFAVANALMFMLGFVLFGSTNLLPQFVQQLLGYTATDAGLVISPGGFAIMFLMPLVGRLVGRFDPRLLILFGLAISVGALWHMSGFSLGVDYRTVALARVFQAVGLAFLFIPISTTAYVGVAREKNNQASALINLARNLGGSVGIAVLTTLLARRGQVHQTYIVDRVNPTDPAYTSYLASLKSQLMAGGLGANEAATRATATIARTVAAQVRLLSFLDAFLLLALLFTLLAPLVLLMRRPPGGPPGGGGGAH